MYFTVLVQYANGAPDCARLILLAGLLSNMPLYVTPASPPEVTLISFKDGIQTRSWVKPSTEESVFEYFFTDKTLFLTFDGSVP